MGFDLNALFRVEQVLMEVGFEKRNGEDITQMRRSGIPEVCCTDVK